MNHPVRSVQNELSALYRRHRVQRLELFGSATGDHFDPARSDLDFLVDFEPMSEGLYADHYFGLLHDLSELLGRPVDLIVNRAIRNPYFRESVNASRELLYAA